MSLRANSSGFSAPFFWNCFTRPGCPTDAMSGGWPPEIAVDNTVGVLSPAGLYLTLTFGYCLLKASMTRWKFFCSAAVQMPTTEILPLTSALPALVFVAPLELELLSSLLLPQPATTAMSAATASKATMRVFLIRLLLSRGRRRRCPSPFPDRRNADCVCRRRLPPDRQRLRASVA